MYLYRFILIHLQYGKTHFQTAPGELLAVAVEEGIAVSSPESVSGTHEDVTLDGGYEY